MATQTVIARRYAKALLELLAKSNNLLEARDRLAQIAQAAVGEAATRRLWLAPQVPDARKADLLEEVLAAVHASRLVHDFCRHLLSRGRITLLAAISDKFDVLCREKLGQATAVVRAPRPVEAPGLERLKRRLSQMTGKTVTCRVEVDPRMIGGIKVLLENTVIDGSVRGKLAAVRAAMAEAAAAPAAQ
jgi:F-type H+-transporting ATPase subunit delta